MDLLVEYKAINNIISCTVFAPLMIYLIWLFFMYLGQKLLVHNIKYIAIKNIFTKQYHTPEKFLLTSTNKNTNKPDGNAATTGMTISLQKSSNTLLSVIQFEVKIFSILFSIITIE